VARSGVGKTTLALDWSASISRKYNFPILHLDNGEMDYQELVWRSAAAESGVPFHAIETGKWKKNAEFCKKVRDAWDKIAKKKPIIHYIDIGGKSVEEIIACTRREYFSKVGRGNVAGISFDYIKTSFEGGNKQEHQIVGEMVDKFKYFVKTDMRCDNKPMLSMFTSVQQNRYGESDDAAVSLSDRIKQFCSSMFILRKKDTEMLLNEPPDGRFGTHYLRNNKCRHFGEDVFRALTPVKMPDGSLKDNYINLKIDNFGVSECGDLQDLVDVQTGNVRPV
jgi:hypothetical protein